MSNYITIKLRRGTAAQWAATNPVLAEGEVGLETDTRKFKVGTGAAAWNSMQYWGGSGGGGAADFIDLGDVPPSYAGQGGKYVKVKIGEDGLEFGTLTVAISDVTGLSSALSNLVPYAGASGDVNLGEWGMQLGNIEFDITPTAIPTSQGSLYWDAAAETLAIVMNGTIQRVGEDLFYHVENQSGSSIAKGTAVRFAGTVGNSGKLLIAPFLADGSNPSSYFMGVASEAIANGASGRVQGFGKLRGINTTAFSEGDILYASTTVAGGFQTSIPVAPNNIVQVAAVISDANNGTIFIRPTIGSNINNDEGVKITTPTNGQVLKYNSTSGLWENAADTAGVWGAITGTLSNQTDLQTALDGKVDENAAITPATKTKISYDAKGLVTAGADAAIADISGLQTALDSKVDENAAITPGTKTKITYDAKGLVTAGADATTADIADSTDKRYVTEAEKTKLSNLSGTNTGDQNLFSTIAVSGQSNVVADTTGDTLTLVAGSNVTITTDASTDTITIAASGGGGGISDGDKGDITVSSSGTVWTIDNDAVTYAKIQNVSNTNRILGRSTAGAGDIEEITVGGDLTQSGSNFTIANKAVTLAKIQDISTARILGRVTASTGVAEELTGTQATTLLDTFTSSLKGLAPASGGGTSNFLRADGTWAAPSGGGGGDLTVLDSNNTQTGLLNTTTETALYSFNLPTDLAAGETLILEMMGQYRNDVGTSPTWTPRIKLGGNTIMQRAAAFSNSTTRSWIARVVLNIVSTSSQKISMISHHVGDGPGALANTLISGVAMHFAGYDTASEDTTTTKALEFTMQVSAASAQSWIYCEAATLYRLAAP